MYRVPNLFFSKLFSRQQWKQCLSVTAEHTPFSCFNPSRTSCPSHHCPSYHTPQRWACLGPVCVASSSPARRLSGQLSAPPVSFWYSHVLRCFLLPSSGRWWKAVPMPLVGSAHHRFSYFHFSSLGSQFKHPFLDEGLSNHLLILFIF